MKIIKKLVNFIAWICTIGILCTAILLIPCLVKQRPLVVLTGSMEPIYPVGSLLYIKHVDYSEIKLGDDITFSPDHGKTIVTHRVVDKTDEGYITKGVANNTNDAVPVTEDKYKGIVTKGIPYVGFLFLYIKKPIVIFSIATVLIMKIIFGKQDDIKEER